jgi:hypothetical protein
MPIWDKVKQELDRAGQVAQDAIDETRIRLEVQRARRLADRAAQVLGYAVHRGRRAGTPLEEAEIERHSAKLAEYEAEAARLEAQLAEVKARWRAAGGKPGMGGAPPSGGGMPGHPGPIDPSPTPPASATTGPAPETATAPQVVEPTIDSSIDDDPWHPTGDRPGGSQV